MATYSYADIAKKFREDKTIELAIKTIRKTVKLHGPRIVQEEISSLAPRAPVDRGAYRRSFKYEEVPGGATIYNFAPYAAIIEYGRRPGAKAPPLQVIIAWLARKRIVKGTGSRSFATEAQYARLRRVAWVVARAIKRRGLPAHHILAISARRLDPIVRDELKTALYEQKE